MSHNAVSEYQQLQEETSKLLGCVGESLIDLCQGPPSEEHAAAYVAIDEQIQKFFTAYYDLRKRHELSKLSVAVLALTKSGKSTLINAFLGDEILPVNNVPETARICRITHAPAAECPEPKLEFKPLVKRKSSGASTSSNDVLQTATSVSSTNSASVASSPEDAVIVVHGAAAVRNHLQQLNRDARSREYVNSDEQLLDITAPLMVLESALSATAHTTTSSTATTDVVSSHSGIKLCLLDTPGPNEAGEEGLKYQVERLLDHVDAAIYLLDYTKLKTAEEAVVLERLKSINPSLVARLCSRLFFAVNKMDQAGESCGLDEEETRQYVADMVTRQLNCPNFRLHPDQVLLITARNAFLSRLVLRHRIDPDNLKRFSRIAFGAFNSAKASSSRSAEVLRAAAADMLEGSGVPELEQAVLGFLFDAAAGVKLVAVLDDVGRLLAEVSNVATSCRGALTASTNRLVSSSQALQSEMDVTLNQFDCIMEGTEDLQVEVVDELRAHLGNLRARLFQYICSSLDTDALHNAAAANAAAAEAAEAGSSSRRRHHRRCCHRRHHRHGYRQYTESSLCSTTALNSEDWDCYCNSSTSVSTTAAAGSGGGGGWRNLRERFVRVFGSWSSGGCDSRDELSSALMDLSEELMAEVQREVSDMWSVMESAANARAGRLVDSLNAAIHQLAARLEGVVEEGLQVRLQPVSLRMAAPDACQFHADLTELIEKGIGAEQARQIRSSERTEVVHELRRGVCRLTPYYVPVPRRRRIVETYTSTSFVLKPDAIVEHFIGVVDAAISATESQLAAYVKSYVRRQVETARDKVKEYGDRYLDSMGAALDAASRSADARAAALTQVEGYCSALAELTSQLAAIQARAELLVPHNSGTGVGVFEQLDYEGESEEAEQLQPQQQQAEVAEQGLTAEATAPPTAAAVEEAEEGPKPSAAYESASSSSSDGSSSSSTTCPDLVTFEDVEDSSTAAAAAEGTLLMHSLPQLPQEEQQQQQLIDLTGDSSSDDEDETAPLLPHTTPEQVESATIDQDTAVDTPAASSTDDPAAPTTATDVITISNSDNSLVSLVADMATAEDHVQHTESSTTSAAAGVYAAKDIQPVVLGLEESATATAISINSPRDLCTPPPAAGAAAEKDVATLSLPPPLAAAATPLDLLTDEDICGGLPLAAAAGAAGSVITESPPASSTVANPGQLVLDLDCIAGARLLPDNPFESSTTAAGDDANAGDSSDAMLPAATEAGAAAADASAQPGSSSSSAGAITPATATTSPAVSYTSAADMLVPSDDYSVITAVSNSTGFSGMTAGTGFTLGSNRTQGSGTSRLQEHLADSVLSGSAVIPTAAAAAAAASDVGTSSMFDSGRFSIHSALGAASMHGAAAAGASGVEQQQQQGSDSTLLDTSMYASIIAHSADESPAAAAAAGSSDTPGSGGYDFQRDFAAALSAAGLDCAAGQGPSDSSSDDWCMVDGDEAQQQQQQQQQRAAK